MSNGWGGVDPASFVDPSDYELGTHYQALVDITITHIRVYGGNGSTLPGRTGRVWTGAGGLLAIATLPDTAAPGWNSYALPVPIPINAGNDFWVSYSTVDSYGFLGSVTYPVNSADGNAKALGAAFHNTPTTFPNTPSSNGFFGIDFVYAVGTVGNQPPVAGLVVTTDGLNATSVVTVVDESPGTCSVKVEWGDGTTSTGAGPQTFQHTYAVAGDYAVMATATDAGNLSDSAAAVAPVRAVAASPLADGTADFIAANPVSVALVPRVETRTAAGGKVRENGVARAAQTFRLIPQNSASANSPGVVQTSDGTQRKATHILLGMPDAIMAVGDTWHVGSVRYEIMELLPDNGYERRARVMANG